MLLQIYMTFLTQKLSSIQQKT